MAKLFLNVPPAARNQLQLTVHSEVVEQKLPTGETVTAELIEQMCAAEGVTLGASAGKSSLEVTITRKSGKTVTLVMGDTHAVWSQHQLRPDAQELFAEIRNFLLSKPAGSVVTLEAQLSLRKDVPAVKAGQARTGSFVEFEA